MTVDTLETAFERPRCDVLSFMATLCLAGNEMRACEGYLLELLAWVSFADRALLPKIAEA